MSALTKIFIVLLVVLSLLLSAGLIVFVNRQENYKAFSEADKKKLALAQEETRLANSEIASIRASKEASLVEKDGQIASLQKDVKTGLDTVTQRDGQIAEQAANIAQLTAANVSTTAALAVAQGDIKARQDSYNALLAEDDKRQKAIVEDSNRITELTNSLEVTTKHDRYMGEQNTQLTAQLASVNAILQKYNISPSGNTLPAGGAINPTPSINLNGLVRDSRTINGVPYATISLGSAEAVTRNMRFNVVDPIHNRFLGFLTVETVGVHESTGRMEGPLLSQIKPNVSEVRTQL
ncbi:MAG TPA: hypothetical protein VFC46_08125 [Humisphaera sp.]|nr:hypothetical protein [Humisphaera sp.]